MNRRAFAKAAGGLGFLIVIPSAGSAQPVRIMKIGNAAGFNDPQQAFITCGGHPRLGYYAAEGVEVEFVNMTNPSQTMQAIGTGQVTFGTVTPSLFLPVLAKNPSLDVVPAYKWLPRPAAAIIVRRDSPFNTVADLKGRRIGVRNLGDTGAATMRLAFHDTGIDDATVEYIAIGEAATAAGALERGRVDAMATFDTAAARVELAGVQARYLPLPKTFTDIGWSWFGVSRKSLREDRERLVGLFRGLAKSTIFAHANLPEAIKIHWSLYPESKPKSKTEEEGQREIEFILRDRKDAWMPYDDDPDQRMGPSTLKDWQAQIQIAAAISKNPNLAKELGDPAKLYTNDLIDDVNKFDRQAIAAQARAFK
ncbi:MAG: ABC transporter substrate-binding protein, partial [Solimonas sp.]